MHGHVCIKEGENEKSNCLGGFPPWPISLFNTFPKYYSAKGKAPPLQQLKSERRHGNEYIPSKNMDKVMQEYKKWPALAAVKGGC